MVGGRFGRCHRRRPSQSASCQRAALPEHCAVPGDVCPSRTMESMAHPQLSSASMFADICRPLGSNVQMILGMWEIRRLGWISTAMVMRLSQEIEEERVKEALESMFSPRA